MIEKELLAGLLIPFLGTSLGAACVFVMKKELSARVQKALMGFAAGVMVAASVWSLLIPAMEESASLGSWSFLPAVIGFWVGTLFLLALDHLIPHLHLHAEQAEGPQSHFSKTVMMALAVTLHNIPEGMAVGVVLAGCLAGGGDISFSAAIALSVGIPRVKIHGCYQGFKRIGNYRFAFASAAALLAVAEKQIMSEVYLGGIYRQRLFADKLGAHTRKLALGVVREPDKNMLARYHRQHRVAEKLQTLIARQALRAVFV